MARISGSARTVSTLGFGRADPLLLAGMLALLFGTAIRFGIGHGRPLWIDETFTGAIAAQVDLASLLRQLRADVNAPLYYVVMFLWSSVAGISNTALRLPSAIFGTVACLLIFRGGAGIDRRVAMLWSGFVSLWMPGLLYGGEARCYALLLLASTATTLAFAGLLATPTRHRACIWAGFAAATILTHYFALVLVVAQGALFTIFHRRQASTMLPAALPFLPAVAWTAYHGPRLAAFAQPDVAWYEPVRIADLPSIWDYVLNSAGIVVLLVIAITVALSSRSPEQETTGSNRSSASPNASTMRAVFAASLIGALGMIALGMMRPSFVPRYLVPFVPGLLLGVALAANAADRVSAYAPVLVLVLFGLPLVRLADLRGTSFNFERASEALAAADATRLVFLWDHPSSPVQDPGQMRAVGGFFLARIGRPVDVVAVANAWRDDPEPALLAAAGSDPAAAILWVYDLSLPKTAAIAHAPRIARDPAWTCRDHGTAPFGALLCVRARPDITPAG